MAWLFPFRVDIGADEIGFGPIVELASGKLLITLNPLFTDQVGPHRDTDSLGFGDGWRAEYDFARNWGAGVEMFGQIEDLSNTGSFNQQNHSIGPTLFWNPGGGDDKDEAKGSDEDKAAGPPAATCIDWAALVSGRGRAGSTPSAG